MFRLGLLLLAVAAAQDDVRFRGCFKSRPSTQSHIVRQDTTLEQCISECRSKYYRYSITNQGRCVCSNYLGEEVNGGLTCRQHCPGCRDLSDVYSTGNLAPGPPRNVKLANVTDTTFEVSWEQPESFTEIAYYLIRTAVIHTFANYVPNSPEYKYPNDTFRTKLLALPATKYNVSVSAVSPDGAGTPFSQITETKVGEFENPPEAPEVMNKRGSTMEIRIREAVNNNGPITSYLVVVVNDDVRPVIQDHLLKSFHEAQRDGIFYYIAAEVEPQSAYKRFVVGDGRYYGKFFNAPLDPKTEYNVIVGVTSTFNGVTKRAFSALDKQVVDGVEDPSEGTPAMIIGLSIAIGLLSFILVAGIVGFIILKSRVTKRRQRLSDNQELTLQGPMIEVENNGYIPEEEPSRANHYMSLKQRLRVIPYSQLKIESNLLGVGKFGRVNSGSTYENNTLVPVAAYSISDKKLSADDKKAMLRDLDLLIKADRHEHVVALLGTCETPQLLFVVLEYLSMNLKDLLLGSRESLPGRFSNMSETQALGIATDVARGMAHLASVKIVHKQICARNIMVANGLVPKISGYGLAQFYSRNNLPDYTRWTALEVFNGQPHNPKSDIWSFACLLWEICVLGGTPYGNISNNEVPERVTKGLRLPQLPYFSDALYQVMLDCWQIDMDERPDFHFLIESLEELKNDALIPSLNFSVNSSFQYEQFYPDMESAVRPVF